MKVLVVGSGGREHALAWKLKQSPEVTSVICAPGNGGMREDATRCFPVAATDIDGLVKLAEEEQPDLTVVGPEAPLAAGLANRLRARGFRVFGPGREAAQLESSKAFAKKLMRGHNIPTGDFKVFEQRKAAFDYLSHLSRPHEDAEEDDFGYYPLVVKADGLAAGKGVLICENEREARLAIRECMDDERFGAAGRTVVVEEFLKGDELSILNVSDGRTIVMLENARDYKRAYENDEGPNTGGMGAFSPSPAASEAVLGQVENRILVPTLHAMRRAGTPFAGTLYAGLMLTPSGPQVLEFNVRFGDPETQPILMRLQSDLFELLWAAVEGGLDRVALRWDRRPAVTVVMASGGYPIEYEKGKVIRGLRGLREVDDLKVFHAGTKRRPNGELVTDGGRVLGVTALGNTVEEARERAYQAVDRIDFEGAFYRADIAAGV